MDRWQCLVKFGHQGAGKYVEKFIVVKAKDIFQAQRKARYFPGVKSHLSDCVLSVEYFPEKSPKESLGNLHCG
jgi:hypothetical protein